MPRVRNALSLSALCCLCLVFAVSASTEATVAGVNVTAECREHLDEYDFVDNLCLNKLDLHVGADGNCKGNPLAILFEVFLFLYAMLGLAIVCDDYLCVALERLCDIFLIREDVAGATIMAFGSAAPEIIINLISTLKQVKQHHDHGEADTSALDATNTGVGAILGSGVIAFLTIPGACALSVEKGTDISLKRRPLLRDITAYTIALLLLCIFFADTKIELWESLMMVGFYVLYVLTVAFAPAVRENYRHKVLKLPKKKRTSFVKKKKKSSVHGALSTGLGTPLIAAADETEAYDSADNEAAKAKNPDGILKNPLDKTTSNKTVSFGLEVSVTESILHASQFYEGEEHENDDAPPSCLGRVVITVSKPLHFMFSWTCIDCNPDTPYENYYPLTFLASFIWVAFLSLIISAVVERWSYFVGDYISPGIMGMVLIAVGAEIPDMIQSVTMAKKGYGSMAVSNAFGSQIINVLMGLGGPWMLANFLLPEGADFKVTGAADLQIKAYFQFFAVAVTSAMLLGVTFVYQQPKVKLTRTKGAILMALYPLVIVGVLIAELNTK